MKQYQAELKKSDQNSECIKIPNARVGPPKPFKDPIAERAKTNGYSPALVAYYNRINPITEQYLTLRTNLIAHYADKPFSLVLTSAQAKEGKTVTCLNLAFALGNQGQYRTVIVDGDLRKGRIAKLLKHNESPGLADVLRGKAVLKDVIKQTVYPTVFVVHAGKSRAEEVSELISRPQLDDIVTQLRRQYDFVLIDTPPINAVSDACMLGRTAKDALLVVRMNKTRCESVERAIHQLKAVDVNLLGLVLTHQKYYIPKCLYRRC